MARVLLPLPDRDFDPTEASVAWRLLSEQGHTVVFATENGGTPAADPRLLEGVLFGRLGAREEPLAWYRDMERDAAFRSPVRWGRVAVEAYDGLWLAGGHAKGMRPYLESESLRAKVWAFWALDRPVAAICHGVVVLARAGVLAGRRTTCLPRYMELTAWLLTAWKLGSYYRTYPQWVESEVRASGCTFERGPFHLVAHGTATDDRAAFVVEDGNYVSGRWPGDAYLLSRKFLAKLGQPRILGSTNK